MVKECLVLLINKNAKEYSMWLGILLIIIGVFFIIGIGIFNTAKNTYWFKLKRIILSYRGALLHYITLGIISIILGVGIIIFHCLDIFS